MSRFEDDTEETLRRIEKQTDNSEMQEGFALNFREKVLTSLTKIEAALEQNTKDHLEIKGETKKITPMEIGLNNHLRHHDRFIRMVLYPAVALLLGGLATLIYEIACHVF